MPFPMTESPNSLTIRLQGGLGNQLFQYALGRKLATERQAELIFDLAWYAGGEKHRHPRPLALREFAVTGTFATGPIRRLVSMKLISCTATPERSPRGRIFEASHAKTAKTPSANRMTNPK